MPFLPDSGTSSHDIWILDPDIPMARMFDGGASGTTRKL
jgi:hypothetical protein